MFFFSQTGEDIWIGLENTGTKCGGSYPDTDCTNKAVWSDGSPFDQSDVPEIVIVIDRLDAVAVRYFPGLTRLDDQVYSFNYKYICEVPC